MAGPIKNELTKLMELFLKMYLLFKFSMYNNDLWLKLTGQNVGRSPKKVLGKLLVSALSKNRILNLFEGSQSKFISTLDLKFTHSKLTWMCSLWVRAEVARTKP